MLLYPRCEKELADVIERAEDKNVIAADPDEPNTRTAQTGDRAVGTDSFGNPATLSNNPDPSAIGNVPSGQTAVNAAGDGISAGFGVGFGPGFPGSPGFTGSAPSGAGSIILPPASPRPVTSVVNE